MAYSPRDEILDALRSAPAREVPPRPAPPPLRERSLDREALVARLIENLTATTAEVLRSADRDEALEKIEAIARAEGWRQAVAAEDEVVRPLNLPAWGRDHGVEIALPRDFADREAYKDWVFGKAQAGVTGVDFAVAESGTLALFHDREQPRLVSLAPVHHVAVVPVERIVGVYEEMLEKAGGEGKMPSQICLITGPSLTSDIQATPTRGMHGPRKLTVVLVG